MWSTMKLVEQRCLNGGRTLHKLEAGAIRPQRKRDVVEVDLESTLVIFWVIRGDDTFYSGVEELEAAAASEKVREIMLTNSKRGDVGEDFRVMLALAELVDVVGAKRSSCQQVGDVVFVCVHVEADDLQVFFTYALVRFFRRTRDDLFTLFR